MCCSAFHEGSFRATNRFTDMRMQAAQGVRRFQGNNLPTSSHVKWIACACIQYTHPRTRMAREMDCMAAYIATRQPGVTGGVDGLSDFRQSPDCRSWRAAAIQ